MQNLREQVKRIAQHDTSVLLVGESGSGKEVYARYLHQSSNRRAGPFVRVPISGLTSANSAAELFGAEEGEHVHFGSLEQANGGTLFLEDIIDMDLGVQARLLSGLKHQSFMRVDGVAPVSINVRIIAATSHDPARAVESGALRNDLYYHLNVVPLEIPPLRSHRDDIPELLNYYIDQFATTEGLPYRRFTVGAQNRLRNYSWPGNVRELKNVVHRLLILGSGADIDQDEIELSLGEVREHRKTNTPSEFDLPLKEAREQFERSYLEYQLRESGGSISKVAQRVGLERTHLYRKIRALGIDPKRLTAGSD
jgi:DNA-binding NtrC family response regulator